LTIAASPWTGSPVLCERDVVLEQDRYNLRVLQRAGDALAAYSARLALAYSSVTHWNGLSPLNGNSTTLRFDQEDKAPCGAELDCWEMD
jgi:hypothetical protein